MPIVTAQLQLQTSIFLNEIKRVAKLAKKYFLFPLLLPPEIDQSTKYCIKTWSQTMCQFLFEVTCAFAKMYSILASTTYWIWDVPQILTGTRGKAFSYPKLQHKCYFYHLRLLAFKFSTPCKWGKRLSSYPNWATVGSYLIKSFLIRLRMAYLILTPSCFYFRSFLLNCQNL